MKTIWLARAQAPSLLVLDRAALLEKAFAAEPENFETAYNIGEAYRIQSFEGEHWIMRRRRKRPSAGMRAPGSSTRIDGYNDLRTGMCLDWLDRHAEAGPFYRRAESLDPNGYFTVANIGWHYVQVGDYPRRPRVAGAFAAARMGRKCRSRHSYLDLVEQKLVENASGKSLLPPGF